MAEPFYFICYSPVDGEDLAVQLGDRLAAGHIPVCLDRLNVQAGIDWDEQIVEALRRCAGLLYLMTTDSVKPNCECKKEWTRALKYKKPIIPLLLDKEVAIPAGAAAVHRFHARFGCRSSRATQPLALARNTREGLLHTKERLEDARRDLARDHAADKARITEEITLLQQQIDGQPEILKNPAAAQQRSQESIARRLEQERHPAEPAAPKVQTRFINRLPMIPPLYFQDRHVETGLIGNFLKDESLRLLMVVGRGGVGKTAMVCRLLRSLQGGQLPDDGGALAVDASSISARGRDIP